MIVAFPGHTRLLSNKDGEYSLLSSVFITKKNRAMQLARNFHFCIVKHVCTDPEGGPGGPDPPLEKSQKI